MMQVLSAGFTALASASRVLQEPASLVEHTCPLRASGSARASKRGRGTPPGVRGSRAWPPRHGTSGRCHLAEAIIVKAESEPHPSTGQPVGLPVDATPARRPGPVTLEGRYGRIEKLDVRHAANLWKANAGHDHIWTYLSAYGL